MGDNLDSLWTEERVTLLKSLWASGMSAGQIVNELEGRFTRNAIIGKISRMGLSGRVNLKGSKTGISPKRSTQPNMPRREKTVAPAAVIATVSAPAKPKLPKEPDFGETMPVDIAPVSEDVSPLAQRVTLLQLTNSTCRWPIGDVGHPNFAFCGGDADLNRGRPYCGHHAKQSYNPATRKSA